MKINKFGSIREDDDGELVFTGFNIDGEGHPGPPSVLIIEAVIERLTLELNEERERLESVYPDGGRFKGLVRVHSVEDSMAPGKNGATSYGGQMTKWLSEDEIDWIEAAALLYGCSEVKDVCTHARDANRLRRGLEHVILDIEGTPFLRATEVLPFLRELLED